jgi:hypothetical protein
MRIGEHSREQAPSHKLSRQWLCGATAAEIESNDVDPVAVDHNELVIDTGARVGARFAVCVSKLNPQPQLTEGGLFKASPRPPLEYNVSMRLSERFTRLPRSGE